MLVFPFHDEMIFLPASGYTKTIGNFYLHAWTDMTEYFMNNNSSSECLRAVMVKLNLTNAC